MLICIYAVDTNWNEFNVFWIALVMGTSGKCMLRLLIMPTPPPLVMLTNDESSPIVNDEN
jgi:hypothetical protein